jgi:Flp pilus assembly pilin Flp
MNWMTRIINRIPSRNGQTMTEYALLLATIATVVVSLYRTSGTILQSLLTTIDSAL